MADPPGSRWEPIDRIALAAFAVLTPVTGVAAVVRAPTALLIALGGMAAAGAVLHVVLVVGGEGEKARRARSALLAGPPIRVASLTRQQIYALGVDREAPEALKQLGLEASGAAYEPRDVDSVLRGDIAGALAHAGAELVVITGHSKAGKSRAALEAIAAAARSAWLLRPAPVLEKPGALAALAAGRPPVNGPVVIWLDDLEDWARPIGLTPSVLESLRAWAVPVVVVATAFGRGARGGSNDDYQDDLKTLISNGIARRLESRPTEAEYAHLRERFGDATATRLHEEGLAEFLIAAPDLVRRLDYDGTPVGRALVRAAIDCRRTGYLDPIPIDWLRANHHCYHRGFATDADVDEGLRWATERLYANTGLLDQIDGHGYDPHDFLVGHVIHSREPIPRSVWDYVIDTARTWFVVIGAVARGSDYIDGAERAFRRGAQADDVLAMFNLGVLLYERGDLEGAEAAYRRADEHGHADAGFNLGLLLDDRGDAEGAEAAYRRADEHGSADAATNLGALLHARGDLDGAEAAWRRADERGDADAAMKLGLLLHARGDLDGAEAAWRRAEERGDAGAASNLGVVLKERGDLEGAEAAFRTGVDRGHPEAAANLGLLLMERGDLEGAEAALRRGDAGGDANAISNLGVLLLGRGDVEGAEAAFRRADERGHAKAAFNLGLLLADRGDTEGAEAAYRRSDERGDASAAFELGVLLQEGGDVEGAEAAWRRGDERGDADAAVNLGVLLYERGDLEDAEAAYRRGDERGDATAAFFLGAQLEEGGDVEGAEAAYRRGDERGDATAAACFGILLRARGDLDGAEAAYRRADERGDADAAFFLGALLQERGDLDGAEAACRRAEERGQADPAFFELRGLLHELRDRESAEPRSSEP